MSIRSGIVFALMKLFLNGSIRSSSCELYLQSLRSFLWEFSGVFMTLVWSVKSSGSSNETCKMRHIEHSIFSGPHGNLEAISVSPVINQEIILGETPVPMPMPRVLSISKHSCLMQTSWWHTLSQLSCHPHWHHLLNDVNDLPLWWKTILMPLKRSLTKRLRK